MNRRYYSGNLEVLRDRKEIPDGCVDLICLDPPVNSNPGCNVLFKAPSGNEAAAQIEAVDDTSRRADASEEPCAAVLRSGNGNAASMRIGSLPGTNATSVVRCVALLSPFFPTTLEARTIGVESCVFTT